jgi:hypothetical protein
MKKKIFVMGMSALLLIFVMGLTACASTDQQALKKAGVPQDQRATLYLVYYDQRLEKIDGKKEGFFLSLYGLLQGWPGALKEEPKGMNEVVIHPDFSIQVKAGEHTLVMSNKLIVGRKNYEGTFNFEAGKKYLVQLTTPSKYESMKKTNLGEALSGVGDHLKESLAGNFIVIMAESKKAKPTYPDYSIKGDQWVKSSK